MDTQIDALLWCWGNNHTKGGVVQEAMGASWKKLCIVCPGFISPLRTPLGPGLCSLPMSREPYSSPTSSLRHHL